MSDWEILTEIMNCFTVTELWHPYNPNQADSVLATEQKCEQDEGWGSGAMPVGQ